LLNRPVVWHDGLRAVVEDGFGPEESGEDSFDAVVGLLSMLDVVLNYRAAGAPLDPTVRRVEGWIFGQNRSIGGRGLEIEFGTALRSVADEVAVLA
jgi:hypothetical protein